MDSQVILKRCWIRAYASLHYYDELQDRYDTRQIWLHSLTMVVLSGLTIEALLEAVKLLPVITLLLKFVWSTFGLGIAILDMQLAPGRRAERCHVLSNHWDTMDLNTTLPELQQAQREDWAYENPRIPSDVSLLQRSTYEATNRFECVPSDGHTTDSAPTPSPTTSSSTTDITPTERATADSAITAEKVRL